MDTIYTIDVMDEFGNAVIGGKGKVYVLYYIAEKAALELEELGSEVQVAAKITAGDKTLLNATIDADSMAGIIKAKSLKVRRELASAENTETVVG